MRARSHTRTSRSSRRTRWRWRGRHSTGSCGRPASAARAAGYAGRGPRVDLRRALAQSVRTGGDVFKLPRRRRRTRPRPLVLLCDISGSMERYSRMLLHFAHAIGRRHRRVEAFVFATELTRVTGELRARRLDEAAAQVSRSVPDWSGGTRIGESLRRFDQRWARRTLHGGPVVLLISDGWDRGDPAVLRDQIRRLQRSCHRLIWLNPLVGTAGLRAADARAAGGAAVRGRLPARTHADQSRRPGAALERAPGTLKSGAAARSRLLRQREHSRHAGASLTAHARRLAAGTLSSSSTSSGRSTVSETVSRRADL